MSSNQEEPNLDPDEIQDEKSGKQDKDILTQQDIVNGVETVPHDHLGRMALENEDGKNNGALPAAYQNQHTNHP